MAITVEELDLWVKSNWTKKFDKQTGLGDPTTLGVVGLGVFDVFENLLTGDMYVWSLELSQYTSNPLFKGFVKSDADVSALLPLANTEFVIVYEAFSLNGSIPKKVGDVITATSTVTTLAGMVTNTTTTSSPPTWNKLEKNLGGIGVDVVRIDNDRRIIIEDANGQIVTAVDSIYDVIENTLSVGISGAEYSSITSALTAAAPGNLISIHPGTYTGNLVYNKDTIVISGEDALNTDHLTIVDGTLSTATGADKLRVANLSVNDNVTLGHGSSHKFFNVTVSGTTTIDAVSGIVEFFDSIFADAVSITAASTATIYFYNCKFLSTVTNLATANIILVDTKTVPSAITGNKLIVGSYGDTFYSESTYADTVSNTTGYKMLVIGADGKIQTAALSAGGGGGGDVYTNATPVPVTLGGITAGTTFTDVPLTEMFTRLLYPYQAPTFASFTITGLSDTEVGNLYPAQNRNANWTTTNSSNITANTIRIIDVSGGNTTLASGLPNTSPASVSIPALQLTTAGSKQFRIEGTNTNTATFSRTLTINWQWAVYYGESPLTSLTSAEIIGLRVKNLTSTANGTYAMQAGNYKYITYPVSFGLKSTFKDQATNLDVAMLAPSTVSVTNSYGITTNYYVHRTLNQLGGSITIIVS